MTSTLFKCAILIFAVLISVPAQAQIFARDPGDEIVLPDEEALQLPSAPKTENLIQFDPGFSSALSYYIDGTSLKAGATDRIVRFTLVVKNENGANNVSYEGLRCDTTERKIYAYGTPDGKWSPARDPQWKPIDKEPFRRTLFNYYLCPRNLPFGTQQEGIDALKRGGHPRAPNQPYN